jgi:hypothetical protein
LAAEIAALGKVRLVVIWSTVENVEAGIRTAKHRGELSVSHAFVAAAAFRFPNDFEC